jgi:glucose/arabinose dehydrogenase
MSSFARMHHRGSLAIAGGVATTLAILLIALGSADDATGRGTPVGDGEGDVQLTSIGTFAMPVNVAFAPGEPLNVYVVEQDGLVRVVENGGSPATFLNLQAETDASGEQGLLGLAFHPNFQSNGLVYAYYSDEDNGDIVVSEFETLSPTQADASSRRQVIRIRHRFDPNHNGGQLLFGPDGYLYLGPGDGGSAGDPRENAQDRKSLLGKILRINPLDPPGARDYRSPKGNPLKGRKGRDEIYARGLRNPFRFSFDPVTKRIAIGDVGQNRFEEVDYETPQGLRNANFGWDRYEGFKRYDDGDTARTPKRRRHDKPIFAYGGASACGGGCSVIGGVVVRDESLTNLYGRYLFADAYAGRLRSFIPRLSRARDVKYLDQGSIGFPTSFAADPVTDEVYVSDIEGPVYRLEP